MAHEWRISDLQFDASPGQWVVDALSGYDSGVRQLLPGEFLAYARIFHPAGRHIGTNPRVSRTVSWSEVAEANQRVAHAEMEWGSIIGSQQKEGGQSMLWDRAPSIGCLPHRETQILTDILGGYTTTPGQCWFGFWEGRNFEGVPPDAARLDVTNGPMLMFAGEIADATRTLQDESPNLWWPEDHAWCVSTNVDLMTTYVGGSADCIAATMWNPSFSSA